MWSRRSIEILAGMTLLATLAACSVTPKRAAGQGDTAAVAQSAAGGKSGAAGKAGRAGMSGPDGTASSGGTGGRSPAGSSAPAAAGPAPVPPEAQEGFDKALALARAGNDSAAEAQLATLAQQYPQFCAPLVDLGILDRKDGNLDAAAKALQDATARDPHSAPAWTELGVTQRLNGKFQDAEQSYAHAIAADPAYAPAYRDRGVLRDLYLDQPAAALGDFEQYRKLAAGDKPVAMWIAELSHRTGIKVPVAGAQPQAAPAVANGQPPAAAAMTPASPPPARN